MRIDAGVVEGGADRVHYDPLIAKVIASSRDARRCARAGEGAAGVPVLGIPTNIPFLFRLIAAEFVDGRLQMVSLTSTGFR